jgi:predicted nucleic acid-binding protein
MIAVDANVAAKWYLPEADSAHALVLLRNPRQLIAPSLIKMEVCAAITRRVRLKEITAAEAKQRCQDWLTDLSQDAVQLIPEENILLHAIELSGKVRHSLQDCLYLAVAEIHGLPLVTADEPFFKKAVPHYANTHFLSTWRMN